MNPQRPQQPSQDAITIQLLQALAQSQTVTINSLQKLNQRIEDEHTELTQTSTNLRNQVRSLTTQLEDLQKRFDGVSEVPASPTTDNM